MKFGDCVLRKAGNVQVGDEVVFELACANYTVEETSMTSAGRYIHRHETGSNSYWPDEMVFVRDAEQARKVVYNHNDFKREIDAAIRAEREACASICETLELPEWPDKVRQPLADAIRQRRD